MFFLKKLSNLVNNKHFWLSFSIVGIVSILIIISLPFWYNLNFLIKKPEANNFKYSLSEDKKKII